eukprot:g5661.t1 g5661   contig2:1003004-1003636(+)
MPFSTRDDDQPHVQSYPPPQQQQQQQQQPHNHHHERQQHHQLHQTTYNESQNFTLPIFQNTKQPNPSLKTNQHLLEVSSRLDNVVSELVIYADLFSDDGDIGGGIMVSSVAGGAAIADTISGEVAALRQKKFEAIDNLRNAIIPFLALAAKSVTEAAVMLAPISGTKVLHSRKDAKRKREVMIQSNSSNNGGGGGGATTTIYRTNDRHFK